MDKYSSNQLFRNSFTFFSKRPIVGSSLISVGIVFQIVTVNIDSSFSQVHSIGVTKERENRKQITSLALDNATWECFTWAQNFYIYGTTLAVSLTTEEKARREAGIAFSLPTLPK